MKLLFFVGEFNGGGAERVISILANNMVERGFDIEILKYHNTENSYKTNPKIVINSVEENTGDRNSTFKNLNWMEEHFKKFDVIISFLAPFNILALLANTGSKTPIIVADRNDPRFTPGSMSKRKLRDLLYRKANLVVTQTSENKEYFDYISNKCVVIPNPIDMKDYVGSALKAKKENKIVSVGRLEPQKNQLMLIDAFNEIKDEFSDYTLVIYGEGAYRSTLEKRINELKLSDRVLLPGQTNTVFDSIKDSKLFVLSSNYEGMPNSLAEAMCLGLPCISTKVSGTKELIEDGKNGLLIDINDKKELINKMRLLLNDVKLSESISSQAVKIADKYSVDNIVDIWCNYINKVKM